MYRLVLLALVAASTFPVHAQDILYYKLEEGAGNTVVNYGDATPGIPRLGQVLAKGSAPIAQAWGPGRFGSGGLAAAPVSPGLGYEINTGWDNVVTTGTDVTIAFFFKTVHPVPGNSYFCGPSSNGGLQPAGIELWVFGSPSEFGHVRLDWSANGTSHDITTLQQDLLTPSYSNWVHLAVVVTRSGSPNCQSAIVRWYVNGVPQIPQAPSGCWHDIYGTTLGPFRFGQWGYSHFMYDEMRLALRAVPASEILEWATTDKSAQAPFGESCSPFGTLAVLDGTSGGLPVIGNAGYTLTVYGLPTSSVLLAIGSNNQQFAGVPLPLDLGPSFPALQGCHLRTSADLLVVPTVIGATGAVDIPLPIPPFPALEGFILYSQALLFSQILGTEMLTNAYATSIGN